MWRFSEAGDFVERECLLFEAGTYADKGVTVTEADLQRIAENSAREVPVRIEHLAESPFDSALGVVTGLRAIGAQLWGTLRQPMEAWRLAQRAGAKALSVGLDVAGLRLVETSFVCRPRIANAQVFAGETADAGADAGSEALARFAVTIFEEGRDERMAMSARQLAESLIGYLRGVTASAAPEAEAGATADFAAERASWEQERRAARLERAERQILEWKREGKLRATEASERLARTLLLSEGSVVAFGSEGESAPVSGLFAEFVRENGAVVPMGELMAADRTGAQGLGGEAARERLVAMAREKAAREGIGYVQAFAAVTAANAELALGAREA